MAREFYQFPFEPYAPIRRQLLKLLRKVNRVRKRAGYAILPPEVLPMRRRVVKPFIEPCVANKRRASNGSPDLRGQAE